MFKFQQNAGQNKTMNRGNKSSENVAKLQYLGTNINIKIVFMKKLQPNQTSGTPPNIHSSIFYIPFCSLKI
jgi:hypothetical protein